MRLLFEVDRRVNEIRGWIDAKLAQAPTLPVLRDRVIDLKQAHALQRVGAAVGEGVEAGADDHVLANASDGTTLDDVLG